MWGKHLIIDMTAGDRERVRSAQHISRFVETLVETIGMKAYGAPLLEHFAEHVPEAAFAGAADRDVRHHRTFLRSLRRRLYGHFLLQGFLGRARRRSGPCGLPSTTHQLHDACTPSHASPRQLHGCGGIRA